MKRRSFVKYSGAVGLMYLSNSTAKAMSQSKNTEQAARIDHELLNVRYENRSTVTAVNGMVCTSHPLAAATGYDVLKSGGNAVDSAIAVNAMLSLVEPMMGGPGGDLFAIVWDEKQKKLHGLNASGRSPFEWSMEKAKALALDAIPPFGPLSWSVPGCVSGWDALLQRFGSRKLGPLLEPAIKYAREGFVVSPIIASRWKPESKATDYDTMAKVFMPGGKAMEYGQVFRNPDLAKFFEILAKGGVQEFYQGQIAQRIVNFSKRCGGLFSMKDFAEHRAEWVAPVSSNYRGYDVWQLPPNGQGLAVLQMLNILENYDIGSLRPNSVEHLHLLIEAKKLAFEDRAVYYADMDFAKVPVEELISKEYGRQRAKLVDLKHAADKVKAGRIKGSSDTVYVTVADQYGNMVSLIQSTYSPWGSHCLPSGLGFCLQNRGALFSMNPQDFNKLEPGKRPFHTIIPAFVTQKGKPVFSFGVTGGGYQPQGQSHILTNILDFGMSVQQAGETPRVWHRDSSTPTGVKMQGSGSLTLEWGFDDKVHKKLTDMGHVIRKEVRRFGGYQGIWRIEGPRRYFGASDPRKDGCAMGY